MGRQDRFYYDNLFPELLNARSVDVKDKTQSIRELAAYTLARTQQMIRIHGLPETMPERDVIRILQTRGYFVTPDPDRFPQLDGKLWALWGGLGGSFTPYYTPSLCTIANPYLQPAFSAIVTLWDQDPDKVTGVIVKHDPYYMGLLPLINRYATLLAEADISLLLSIVITRTPVGITAPDDRSRESADNFIKKLFEGEIQTMASDEFLSGIKSIPITAGGYNVITQLIEAKQYLRAGLYNDLGLNANYNMKRESINSVEAQLDDDALLPFADEILETLQTDFDVFNQRYGTDITVELGSAWQNRQDLTQAEVEQAEAEADATEAEAEAPDEAPEQSQEEGGDADVGSETAS